MCSYGVPDAQASFLLGIFTASRNGEFNVLDPALGQLLGHRPTSLQDILADTLST